MDAGRILAMDTPAALVRGLHAATRVALPLGALTEQDAAGLPGADKVQVTDSDLVMTTRSPSVLVQALAERDRLDGVSVRTATLEDVFLHLTGREYRA
jgi:ABC-2 type transport system ATP-binding protein